MKSLGEKIRELRIKMQWNQKNLAIRAGLLRRHIADIEHGSRLPGKGEIRGICQALALTIDVLLANCSDDSLPRWALVRVAGRLRCLVKEMNTQLLRLPVPPEEMGDGPQERVDYVFDVLKNVEVYAWYDQNDEQELKTRLVAISRLVREALDKTKEYRLIDIVERRKSEVYVEMSEK